MELLTVKKYVLGPLETNSYLVIGPKGNALLVDAPPGALTIALYLVDRNIVNLTHILITHAHFDHVADAEPIKEASGAKLVMGRDDMLILSES
ncbi:MAG: MBL fold metallo-hydrolase, partial [Thermoprotei archaeon]